MWFVPSCQVDMDHNCQLQWLSLEISLKSHCTACPANATRARNDACSFTRIEFVSSNRSISHIHWSGRGRVRHMRTALGAITAGCTVPLPPPHSPGPLAQCSPRHRACHLAHRFPINASLLIRYGTGNECRYRPCTVIAVKWALIKPFCYGFDLKCKHIKMVANNTVQTLFIWWITCYISTNGGENDIN